MELEKELQASIKKNLPQQVGDILKQRLEQADKDAKELDVQKRSVETLTTQVASLLITIQNYKQFDVRNGLLDSLEKELIRERDRLDIEKLTYQLQSEKDKTTFSQNLAMGLVRNTEYKKTIFDSESGGQPFTDGNGYTVYPIPTCKSYISTENLE